MRKRTITQTKITFPLKRPLLAFSMLLLCCLSFSQELFAQENSELMTREQINALIERHFVNGEGPFNWNTTNARTIWSAAILSDSVIAVGYKPTNINRFDFKRDIGNYNFNAPEWEGIRQDIVNKTLSDIATRNPNSRLGREYLMPFGEKKKLPYLMIRVPDLETVEMLMAREDIRFVEPMGYTLEDERNKSGAGCSDYSGSVNPVDLISISGTCNAVRSWHHDPHNIPCAWSNGWAGQGIGVAVLDSGVSDDQSQLNLPDFAACESAGRSFNKTGFYTDAPSGSDDCGHGSSMSGLLVGPWNDNGTPVGIAYKADFNSYRVAENVLLDTSEETDAVATAFTTAADNPDIKIASMSLGWVFSSGVIETAVQYADARDLMMFCAAGTSTSLTNWYPVIFPAWMPETIACTGINDAPINSRSRCETCHSGPEVDFVAVMERAADQSRKSISLGMPDLSSSYVGGSSASTASLAGMAAIIWSANPTESRQQIYNRMAQASDYYPNRDNRFGWGKVDVCKAADPNFAAPCNPNLANSSVTIEITNITFPSTSDNGPNAEWVIDIAGQKYLFEVPTGGASGDPSVYFDVDECGGLPMIINLGSTNCGAASIPVTIEVHEDDGFTNDCDYGPGVFDGGDNDYSMQTVNINFTNNTFTHSGATGNFVFSFNATCTPTSTPAVSVGGLARACEGDTSPEVDFNFAGGTPPYTATYNINGGTAQNITTTGTNTSASVMASTAMAGTYNYNITQVSDANGCNTQTSTYTLEVLNTCILEVAPKILLQGAYDMTSGQMTSHLNSMMSPMDPYGIGTMMGVNALAGTGDDAIVDWVLVELREETTNAVLASVAALVQCDGDVVSATDGVSPVQIPYNTSGNYHLAIHHRNHLAVMTNTPVSLLPTQQ